MKNTFHLNLPSHAKTLFAFCVMVVFFVFTQPAFAQSEIIELFISEYCAPNETADQILHKLKAEDRTSGVLALTCDLADPWCAERRSLYTRKKVLRRYSTPSAVVNGRYDVLAYDETVMRSALAMVRSTMSLPRILVGKGVGGLAITFPAVVGEDYYTPWVVVYNLETTKVVSAEELDYLSGDMGVCLSAPIALDKDHGVAVFLHKPNSEIAAVGNYAGD